MKKLLFSIVAVTLLLGACKKDENNASRKDVLMSGKWKVTALTAKISGSSSTQDLYANLDACEQDNLVIFRSDMHYVGDAGATKCDPSEPQQEENGLWELTENDTKLKITDGSNVTTESINQLDNNTLKISQTIGSGGATYTYTATFTHVF